MNQDLITTRKTCRVCDNGNLAPIFSLGDFYVSDFLTNKEESLSLKAPLELVFCNPAAGGCGLLQLRHTVSHEAMYRNYWYRSGMNKTMTDELVGIAAKVESLIKFAPGDFVIDIGANDGTLLRGYKTEGLKLVGYEPAKNLKQYNFIGTTHVFEDLFSFDAWDKMFPGKKAKAITAIAMFYDIEDPNAFINDISRCLDDDGIFIIQMSYLPLMLSTNELGNICHEHLEYYSLFSLENLLKRHALEVVDVELNDINGGSFRIYIGHQKASGKNPLSVVSETRIAALREYEKKLGLDNKKVYEDFVARVDAVKKTVVSFIKDEIAKSKKVYVYGASTKGNTVLQYFGLDSSVIVAAAERNPDKWGKKTVGTTIPIVSEDEARKAKPDYFLVLPWHFLKEFVSREKEFFEGGGHFIVPFPEVSIIGKEGRRYLPL